MRLSESPLPLPQPLAPCPLPPVPCPCPSPLPLRQPLAPCPVPPRPGPCPLSGGAQQQAPLCGETVQLGPCSSKLVQLRNGWGPAAGRGPLGLCLQLGPLPAPWALMLAGPGCEPALPPPSAHLQASSQPLRALVSSSVGWGLVVVPPPPCWPEDQRRRWVWVRCLAVAGCTLCTS